MINIYIVATFNQSNNKQGNSHPTTAMSTNDNGSVMKASDK